MRRRLLCLLAAFALLAAPACSDDDNGDGDTVADGITTTTLASDAVQVTMKDFSFDPEKLEVPAAGTAISLVNDGSAAHTFTVDELKVDQEVAAGSQVEVRVEAPSGGVTFYCRFHKAQGMEGTLQPKA